MATVTGTPAVAGPTPAYRVPTRQPDRWQAYADRAITGWSTH
jgi:hypothetical protein